MKKYVSLLSFLMLMLLSISTAFAGVSEKVTIIDDNYPLQNIRKLAITTPYYSPSALTLELNEKKRPNAPQILTKEMLAQAALNVAKEDNVPFEVISNDAIAAQLFPNDPTIDQVSTTYKKAYKQQIKNYADAYVVFTFSNDSYVSMTADIYDAKDNHWIYSYRIVNGKADNDTLENYNMFMHKFYRTLGLEAEKQTKA